MITSRKEALPRVNNVSKKKVVRHGKKLAGSAIRIFAVKGKDFPDSRDMVLFFHDSPPSRPQRSRRPEANRSKKDQREEQFNTTAAQDNQVGPGSSCSV